MALPSLYAITPNDSFKPPVRIQLHADIILRHIRSVFCLAVASRAGERKWYALRIVRPVERESGFTKHPNTMFNSAPFGRSDSPASAGLPVNITLGDAVFSRQPAHALLGKNSMTSSQLVDQRVRNRVIEMLEWLIECESTPSQLGMNELINSWEDWVPIPLPQGYFTPPVFTVAETDLLREVSAAIDKFCDATPQSIEDEMTAIMLPQWAVVISAAKPALSAMQKRGRMSEEEEQCLCVEVQTRSDSPRSGKRK